MNYFKFFICLFLTFPINAVNDENYYTILGLERSATQEEIKKAHREKFLLFHSDRWERNKKELMKKGYTKETAEEKGKEINNAYQILSDPIKKSRYDAELRYSQTPTTKPSQTYKPYGRQQPTAPKYTPPYEPYEPIEQVRKKINTVFKLAFINPSIDIQLLKTAYILASKNPYCFDNEIRLVKLISLNLLIQLLPLNELLKFTNHYDRATNEPQLLNEIKNMKQLIKTKANMVSNLQQQQSLVNEIGYLAFVSHEFRKIIMDNYIKLVKEYLKKSDLSFARAFIDLMISSNKTWSKIPNVESYEYEINFAQSLLQPENESLQVLIDKLINLHQELTSLSAMLSE